MANVVGVRFRPAGRIYYFDPAGKELAKGTFVIVETTRGIEAGRVVIAPKQVAESELTDPLKPILRQATEDDLRQLLAFKSKEKNALVRCAQRVDFHKLPMKLVEAEYTYDGSRLTFYFTAEERVDFRALVRDLAAQFRTRIELRQIGARDQAKLLGGVGPCGKTLCCSSWLTEFGVVSIKMAKEQGLPLNPAKISGVCGRLMCCLAYENDLYIEAKKGMPAVGAFIDTPSGLGKVIGINVIKQSAEVMLESGATVQVPVNELAAPKRSGGVSCDVGGGNCCKTKRPNGAGESSGPASARGDDRLN
ncbi:MAG TPA: stage 0 sporulation family protein [Ktedonobacterales bacterium]|nr:stage 0 sporulation family protein [Ktedonobacterales bacterium]